MTDFYVFETCNDAAVGPFTNPGEATAWMLRIVPPEDHRSTENFTGWRIGTLIDVFRWVDSPELETPEHAEARYAECYAEYYPTFKPPS